MLLIRIVRARPRLFFCTALGAITFFVIPDSIANRATNKLILSWNVGARLYLALAVRMMFSSDRNKLRSRAVQQDDGRIAILVLVILAAVATIGAIRRTRCRQGTVRDGALPACRSRWTDAGVVVVFHAGHVRPALRA